MRYAECSCEAEVLTGDTAWNDDCRCPRRVGVWSDRGLIGADPRTGRFSLKGTGGEAARPSRPHPHLPPVGMAASMRRKNSIEWALLWRYSSSPSNEGDATRSAPHNRFGSSPPNRSGTPTASRLRVRTADVRTAKGLRRLRLREFSRMLSGEVVFSNFEAECDPARIGTRGSGWNAPRLEGSGDGEGEGERG